MPNLPELPEIEDARTETLRLKGTLTKRLPGMPSGDLNDLAFTNARQLEAEQLMNEMRYVYDISRRQSARSKAIAREKNRRNDRQMQRSSSAGARQLGKAQRMSERRKKSRVLRNARDVLGMGTDLYR